MNIGIFGDSFCDGSPFPHKTPWYQMLADYGHNVTSYGECASSSLYSANLIRQYHHNYELIIWCVTSPNRISFLNSNNVPVHVHWPNFIFSKDDHDPLTLKRIDVIKDWAKYVQDTDQESLINDCVARHFLTVYPNLMIVPCFEEPLKEEFCLGKIVTEENNYYFPNLKNSSDIYRKYSDLRVCHMTDTNNEILAKLINGNLNPGIFSADLSQFVSHDRDFNYYFEKLTILKHIIS